MAEPIPNSADTNTGAPMPMEPAPLLSETPAMQAPQKGPARVSRKRSFKIDKAEA